MTTRDPSGKRRGMATVRPSIGRVPEAVRPVALGPQQVLQWQNAVNMAVRTFVFINSRIQRTVAFDALRRGSKQQECRAFGLLSLDRTYCANECADEVALLPCVDTSNPEHWRIPGWSRPSLAQRRLMLRCLMLASYD